MPEVPSGGTNGAARAVAAAPARESAAMRKAGLVQQFPLFAGASQADCREIVSAARETEYSRRDTLFLEGDPVRSVILLISGSAKVMQFGQNGTEVILRLVGPGEVVGMVGFCVQCQHCSMAQTLSAATALVWEANVFEALTERFPVLRRNIVNVVSQRLQDLEERYREISTEKVAVRLSHQLVRLFNQVGRRVNGNGTLEINLSREELAQLTGTTLFTVSRLLSDWDERGVVSTRRESVSVHNVQALRELAESE